MKKDRRIREPLSSKCFSIAVVLIVTVITVICFYPMYYVLMASFSDPYKLMAHRGGLLLPTGFSIGGYELVLQNPNIYLGYRNTLIYVIVGTALNMLMTTLGAYALSRPHFTGKKVATFLIVFTMYFSGGLIPNYLLVKELHMLNTMWALMIPGAVGTWNLLVLRTAFKSAPASLEEAAIIDGANDFQVLFYVLLPVTKASMAVILLFYAVGHWNSWFNAMIYLTRARELYPLQLFLREILQANTMVETGATMDFSGELIKYCTIVVSTLPILCLYPFLQRYFVKGVMLGSVKG